LPSKAKAWFSIVEAIERGRDDLRAGRVVPHGEVAGKARGIIKATGAGG
jgi:predicted transcriptional regulator